MVYEYPYLPLPITWNLVDPKKVKGKGRFLSLELNLEYPSSPLKLLRSESLSHIWYLKKTLKIRYDSVYTKRLDTAKKR